MKLHLHGIFCLYASTTILVSTGFPQTGQPKLDFNNTGHVTTLAPGSTDAFFEDGAVQTDGRIISAGFATFNKESGTDNDFLLVRYNADGTIDPSFGDNGFVITDFGLSHNQIFDIVMQDDGKIVAGGRTGPSSANDCALARYLPNGLLDPDFGNGGKVVLNLNEFGDDEVSAVEIQQDGKILIAGNYYHFNSSNESDILLARLNSNGDLDNTFGAGGKTLTDFDDGSDLSADLHIAADGKIIVSGSAGASSNEAGSDVALIKYNVDGSLDNTFGTGGKVTTDVNNSTQDIGRSIDIQTDNKIVVGGSTFVLGAGENGFHFLLVRYLADGNLDNSFGQNGVVVTDFGPSHDAIYSLLVTGNKIIVGGDTKTSLSQERPEDYDLALARYNMNGALDNSFGNSGKVTSDFAGQTGLVSSDAAKALAIFANTLYAVGGRTLFQTADIFNFHGVVAAYLLEQSAVCLISDLTASPATLWPPNNKMKPVTINYQLTGTCLSDLDITISKDEEDKPSEVDWEVIDDHHLMLRAERNGSGDGRIYTIKVEASDEQGNTVSAQTTVVVPKSMAIDNSSLHSMSDMRGAGKAIFTLGSNPTTSYFQLRSNVVNMPAKVSVYDIYGRLIEVSTIQNNWTFGHTYNPGVYLVVINNGIQKEAIKAIKIQ